jgi:hypothetical protein
MFEWPLDKLAVVNAALAQCGSNPVATADDGSEEWKAASPAYELGLSVACESHDWNWLTEWRTLNPSPDAPADTYFDTAYPLPGDLVHLIMVRISDGPCNWTLLKGQLLVNAQGGPPAPSPPSTPAPVTIKGIFSTNSDPTFATPTVVAALQMYTMSGIYRGLKKDTAEAGRLFTAAEQMMARARTRHDMQEPRRAMFNSRARASRYMRRPWLQTPPGWGGTGSPN